MVAVCLCLFFRHSFQCKAEGLRIAVRLTTGEGNRGYKNYSRGKRAYFISKSRLFVSLSDSFFSAFGYSALFAVVEFVGYDES